MNEAPRVGLVLGAGGIAGHAFHAGVLAALERAAGWDARTTEIVVGTSAGSIVAAGLRAGIPARDLYARVTGAPASAETDALLAALPDRPRGHYPTVERRWSPWPASPRLLARLVLAPWKARLGLLTAAGMPVGRRDPTVLGADVDVILDGHPPDGGLWITAVRLADGERVVFGRDELDGEWSWGNAVAASCAIPGFFAPVEVGGERLVDGGAHSSTNADLLAGRGLDLVVVLAPMASVRAAAFQGFDAPFRAVHRFRLGSEAAALRRSGTTVVAFQPTLADLAVMGFNAMDPDRAEAVAHRAFESATARIEARPHLLPAGMRVA